MDYGGISMKYKLVVADDMNDVQQACNQLGERGWKLVTAFPETLQVQQCCGSQPSRKVILIFAKPMGD
jgi:hypothetical protein